MKLHSSRSRIMEKRNNQNGETRRKERERKNKWRELTLVENVWRERKKEGTEEEETEAPRAACPGAREGARGGVAADGPWRREPPAPALARAHEAAWLQTALGAGCLGTSAMEHEHGWRWRWHRKWSMRNPSFIHGARGTGTYSRAAAERKKASNRQRDKLRAQQRCRGEADGGKIEARSGRRRLVKTRADEQASKRASDHARHARKARRQSQEQNQVSCSSWQSWSCTFLTIGFQVRQSTDRQKLLR